MVPCAGVTITAGLELGALDGAGPVLCADGVRGHSVVEGLGAAQPANAKIPTNAKASRVLKEHHDTCVTGLLIANRSRSFEEKEIEPPSPLWSALAGRLKRRFPLSSSTVRFRQPLHLADPCRDGAVMQFGIYSSRRSPLLWP